jgi:membrane associated rhomboid family serine protease
VLRWIASSADRPWFPSQYSSETGVPRDALDEPLNQLRLAGLVAVATWVKGKGQGYTITPEGERILDSGAAIPLANTAGNESLSSACYPALPEICRLEKTLLEPPPVSALPIDPRPPIVVPALLIANLLWFFVGLVAALRMGLPLGSYLYRGNELIAHRLGSVGGIDLLHGEWWRLLTAAFVHAGIIHLVFNLVALSVIGPLAELLWGRRRLAIIYVVSALGGSCLAMALQPDSWLVGASGAIWGVMMSLIVWFMLFSEHLPTDVRLSAARRFGTIVVLNAGLSFLPGISWQGHLGGAIAGFISASLLNAIRFGEPMRRRLAVVLLVLLPAASVGGLISVMSRGEAWTAYRKQIDTLELQRAAIVARDSYNQAAPLLAQLRPDVMKPLQTAAIYQAIRPQPRRNAGEVADLMAMLANLKATADRAAEMLNAPPVGIEGIDQLRANAREFALANSGAIAILEQMLTAEGVPDAATSQAWGDARRRADALWLQIKQR